MWIYLLFIVGTLSNKKVGDVCHLPENEPGSTKGCGELCTCELSKHSKSANAGHHFCVSGEGAKGDSCGGDGSIKGIGSLSEMGDGGMKRYIDQGRGVNAFPENEKEPPSKAKKAVKNGEEYIKAGGLAGLLNANGDIKVAKRTEAARLKAEKLKQIDREMNLFGKQAMKNGHKPKKEVDSYDGPSLLQHKQADKTRRAKEEAEREKAKKKDNARSAYGNLYDDDDAEEGYYDYYLGDDYEDYEDFDYDAFDYDYDYDYEMYLMALNNLKKAERRMQKYQ